MRHWIRLESPQIALNSPPVKRFIMKYSPVIPWDWAAHRILAEVPHGVKHLIFNCHGHAETDHFKTPHLAIGTAIHPGNVSAFDQLASIDTLCVIWLSACTIGSSAVGVDFCKDIAKRSRSYVVTHMFAVPDVAVRSDHIEDYCYTNSRPIYIDWDGDVVRRDDFFALGGYFGFWAV
jgi:hypothetical protein